MATKVIIKQFKNKAKKPVAGLTPEHAVYDANGVRLDAKLGSWNLSNIRKAQTEGVRAVREAAKQYDHQTVINNSTITNAADEEDITVRDNVLSLKDRTYIEGVDEMGYVILRKNKSFAEQVTKENTIYEIRYNFIIENNITIPANCILKFNGGYISGKYTITGNNTGIQAGLCKIFNTDVILAGTWNVAEAYPEWFGAKGDGVTDDSIVIQKICNYFSCINFNKNKTYFINNDITIKSVVIFGNNCTISSDKYIEIKLLLSSIRDFIIRGPQIDIKSSNVYLENIISINSHMKAFCVNANDVDISTVSFINCECYNSFQNGFEIIGGSDRKITNILYLNCIAKTSGKDKTYGDPDSGRTWCPGFVIESNALGSAHDITVENISYINCIADDSLESGFHVEQSSHTNNINYINCISKNNGLRKYYKSDKYLDHDIVYEGADTITFGAGFIVKNGCNYIGCKTIGNFNDVFFITGSNLFIPFDKGLFDIETDKKFNFSNAFKHDNSNCLIDGDFRLSSDFILVHGTSGNESSAMYQCFDNYTNKQFYVDKINKAIVFNSTWTKTTPEQVGFPSIKVNPNKTYRLKLKVTPTESPTSINNETLSIRITRYDNNYAPIGADDNIILTHNGDSAKDFDIPVTVAAGVYYFDFMIDVRDIGISSDSKYLYTAPIISDIKFIESEISYGNTRPSNPYIGQQFFDTTSGVEKPIWYKGNNIWVDATGTDV